MRTGLRTQLMKLIMLIVLTTITITGITANVLIHIQFEKYAERKLEVRSADIAANLSRQYNSLTGQWNTGYVHGVGMYALYEGYLLRLYDRGGAVIWDAQNHDMTLCIQIMEDITERMAQKRPYLKGGFISKEYPLEQNGQIIGILSITCYEPYFMNENDFKFLDTLNIVFIIVGLLSLIGSLIAGRYLAERISFPIVKTAHIANQIAEGSNHIRFEGRTKTRELEELVTAVNHMADSLDHQEDLRKQLTTDVAHELRTPLTAIASHLEAMIDGVWEATPERLKSCYEEIGRISGLVADMESLAQAESENLKLSKSPVDLLELSYTVGRYFEIESAKKNISVEIQGESTVINADRNKLNQVIINLLSNALKYTPENGHIRISVHNTEKNGIMTVEDDGIGIPENELPLIFERFYRTDKSRNRKTGGAGIGLTIAKAILNAHRGKIDVTSSVGHGSCFTVTLPKNVNE